jgi:integrase
MAKKTRPRGSIDEVAPGKYEYFDQTIHGLKKDAERVRAGVVRDLHLGIYQAPTHKTLNEYLDEWLRGQKTKVSLRTIDGYASSFDRYLRPALGKTLLPSLKPPDIQAVYNELNERGLSAVTIRHLHVPLKCALKRAVQLGLLPRNPADPVEVPKVIPQERRVLSPEEATRFLEAAATMPHGLIFELALLTGMRPEEYLALQWPDVDFVRKLVVVQRVLVCHKKNISFEKPKTAKSRRAFRCHSPC